MLEPVTRLNRALEGRYRVERELGQGGMAIVYLAEDLRHVRKVALKVLKPELVAIVGAERFLSEIRTTAALQHPHILPLHDSGDAGGLLFFVTPYVEGESLRERLERERQLPVDEAIRIATEVADALDYAHRQGVIHRDVKPGNILLQENQALVADFGIALALDAAGGNRLTETGLSPGTPSYMSPEQATGERHVGPPADIYALGCVLYEMLAGEPPYTGRSAQLVLAKIITGTPDSLTKQRSSVPPNVDAAARKALEKIAADRFQAAGDFARALSDPRFRYRDKGAEDAAAAVGVWKRLAIGVGGLALASVGILLWLLDPADQSPPGTRFEVGVPEDLSVYQQASPDISQDGMSVVFSGVSADGRIELWLRRMSDLSPVPIQGTENGVSPRFSPDGQRIAFIRDDHLEVASIDGATTRTVLPQAVRGGVGGLAWGPDGRIYFGRGRDGIWRTGVDGEGVEQVVAPAADEVVGYYWPEVLPNGRGVIFTAGTVETRQDAEIRFVSLESGEVTTMAPGQMARYAWSGHLVYASADGTLLAAPFDADRLRMGSSRSLAEQVAVAGNMASSFALSRTGTLVYLPEAPPSSVELVWVTRAGEATPVDPDWRFVPGGGIWGFDLDPQADRVAVSARVDDNTDIWVKELPDGAYHRLTFDVEAEAYPAWSPDGQFVTYWRSGPQAGLWRRRADGAGTPEVLLEGGPVLVEGSWSPDGQWVVGRTTGNQPTMGIRDIVGFRPGSDSAPVPLVADPEVPAQNATLSPDGRWLAYSSADGGQFNVYVSSFPDVESERVRISTDGGMAPLWARSGRELFFWDLSDNVVIAVQVASEPGFRVLERETLFPIGPEYARGAGSSRVWTIIPDDQRFLMARSVASGPRRYVVDQTFGAGLEQWR